MSAWLILGILALAVIGGFVVLAFIGWAGMRLLTRRDYQTLRDYRRNVSDSDEGEV